MCPEVSSRPDTYQGHTWWFCGMIRTSTGNEGRLWEDCWQALGPLISVPPGTCVQTSAAEFRNKCPSQTPWPAVKAGKLACIYLSTAKSMIFPSCHVFSSVDADPGRPAQATHTCTITEQGGRSGWSYSRGLGRNNFLMLTDESGVLLLLQPSAPEEGPPPGAMKWWVLPTLRG